MPRIEVLPGKNFECGTYCLNPPPACTHPDTEKDPCIVPPGYCTQTEPAYCGGEYKGGVVVVTEGTLANIPHEFIHHIVQHKDLWHSPDGPGDPDHEGPWWHCEGKEEVPPCAGLWGFK